MTVEVLYIDDKVTAEQVLLDVTNQIKEHKAVNLAIIYKDSSGYYRSCTTDMDISELHFFGAMLVMPVIKLSERDS